jgi:hypothetical protein
LVTNDSSQLVLNLISYLLFLLWWSCVFYFQNLFYTINQSIKIGGYNGSWLDSIYHYHVEDNSWALLPLKLPEPLIQFVACYLTPYLCIFGGGTSDSESHDCWRIHIDILQQPQNEPRPWESLPSLPFPACGASLALDSVTSSFLPR